MSLNRYRMRHLARKKHRGAMRSQALLKRPDRLLGIILFGNTFANIMASSIGTFLMVHWFGDAGIAIATVALTIIILIFAEVMPKTFGAFYPERYAWPASIILKFLLKVFYPLVWLMNTIANSLLYPLGIHTDGKKAEALSAEEIRSVVHESKGKLHVKHHSMLLGVLDLEKATVADCMVPRNNIEAININASWKRILRQLTNSHYSKLPVYVDNLDNVVGVLHLRKIIKLVESGKADKNSLERILDKPYFVPETTTLQQQLLNFQRNARDIGIVVDEYGDLMGLITVEDVVEEVVGEFSSTTQPAANDYTELQSDGSVIADGAMTVRDINRDCHMELPTNGPKTLSGLIIEHLEKLPTAKATVNIGHYRIEVLKVKAKAVKRARIVDTAPKKKEK